MAGVGQIVHAGSPSFFTTNEDQAADPQALQPGSALLTMWSEATPR